MPSSIQEANAEVRTRGQCRVCGDDVGSDHGHKYMAAGGALEGPFCSRDCHFAFLMEGDDG